MGIAYPVLLTGVSLGAGREGTLTRVKLAEEGA